MSGIADDEVFGRVRWALEKDARVPSANLIHILVENGIVQLWGEVASDAEKTAADTIARGQPGVREVSNGLTVAMTTPRLDERKELAAAVERALEIAPGVDSREVGVRDVDRGQVRLAGRAQSMAEERAAIDAVAAVPGVREVVSEVAIGEAQPGEAVDTFDDAALRSMVNSAISERGVTIYGEKTLVKRGVVHLRGRVVTAREIELAAEVAAAVRGVNDVVNELVLDHAEGSTNPDEALAARVTRALQHDRRVSPADVHVECTRGDCHLFGFVDSIDDLNAAVEVAQRVPGVQRVWNDVVLRDRTSLGGTRGSTRGSTSQPAPERRRRRHR